MNEHSVEIKEFVLLSQYNFPFGKEALFLKPISVGKSTNKLSPVEVSISVYQVIKYWVTSPLVVLYGSTLKPLIFERVVTSRVPPLPSSIKF